MCCHQRKLSWSWRSQVKLVEWDGLSSKEIKIDADGTIYYNRVRQMSVTLREAATFGVKVIIMMIMAVDEPWRWVECTGCTSGSSNNLPDHDDMTAWMFKVGGLKVEISRWNTLGQIRSSSTDDLHTWPILNIPSTLVWYGQYEFRDESNAAYEQEQPNQRAETNWSFPIVVG